MYDSVIKGFSLRIILNYHLLLAGESQANRRYLYFAQKVDVEEYDDVSAVFRSTVEGETRHAHGHLEYLEETGAPAIGKPIGATRDNSGVAIAVSVWADRPCGGSV